MWIYLDRKQAASFFAIVFSAERPQKYFYIALKEISVTQELIFNVA